jgi:hypothetical protein
VWRRQEPPSDVIELLEGIGRILQEIDAKLERIIELLQGEYE